ncbi:DUF5675 family protein [Halanaerobaculum tunisiense]
MSTIRVVRKEETGEATLGEIFVDGERIGHTLEQPWQNNKQGESCIPPGKYWAYLRDQEQSNSRWDYNPIQFIDVHNREYIQIHIGNYPEDTEGCILPGKGRGKNAVWNSADAFEEIVSKIDKTKPVKVIIEYV